MNSNSFNGTLPDGEYGVNTRIDFCCRCDGSYSTPISLPLDNPIFLMHDSCAAACQRVSGTSVNEERVLWDDEDDLNRFQSTFSSQVPAMGQNGGIDHAILFCYYSSGKHCVYTLV